MFSRLWEWIQSLYKKTYDVTVWFEGDTVMGPDGVLVSNRKPKTYYCKKIVKLSPKHIKLVDVDDQKIEIKTVNQVGYDIIEKKYTKSS